LKIIQQRVRVLWCLVRLLDGNSAKDKLIRSIIPQIYSSGGKTISSAEVEGLKKIVRELSQLDQLRAGDHETTRNDVRMTIVIISSVEG
jgi:hypothetical protein